MYDPPRSKTGIRVLFSNFEFSGNLLRHTGIGAHTGNVCKMFFLQESWMSKGTGSYSLFGQFVAHVWSTKAVSERHCRHLVRMRVLGISEKKDSPHACIFGCWLAILSFYLVNPFWNRFVCKLHMLLFPCLIIKIRIGLIVTIAAMLPHGVLQ